MQAFRNFSIAMILAAFVMAGFAAAPTTAQAKDFSFSLNFKKSFKHKKHHHHHYGHHGRHGPVVKKVVKGHKVYICEFYSKHRYTCEFSHYRGHHKHGKRHFHHHGNHKHHAHKKHGHY